MRVLLINKVMFGFGVIVRIMEVVVKVRRMDRDGMNLGMSRFFLLGKKRGDVY